MVELIAVMFFLYLSVATWSSKQKNQSDADPGVVAEILFASI